MRLRRSAVILHAAVRALLLLVLVRFCLDVMGWQAPGRDHSELAWADAVAIAEAPPLFRGDDARLRTAALVLAVEYRESGFRNDAVGRTNDHCAMQVHGRPELRADALACVRVGLAMLRESTRACPDAPVAFYAEGPGGCESLRARRISDDRVSLARYYHRSVAGSP